MNIHNSGFGNHYYRQEPEDLCLVNDGSTDVLSCRRGARRSLNALVDNSLLEKEWVPPADDDHRALREWRKSAPDVVSSGLGAHRRGIAELLAHRGGCPVEMHPDHAQEMVHS